jgi:probable addiction module antidote protein
MSTTVTTRYDVAEHLRTPEEMAAYLEACLEEADGDAAFIAKALGDIAREGHVAGGEGCGAVP